MGISVLYLESMLPENRNCCRLLDHIDKAYFTNESERDRMKAGSESMESMVSYPFIELVWKK